MENIIYNVRNVYKELLEASRVFCRKNEKKMQIHIFPHNSNPFYSPLKTFLHFFLLPYSLYQHATKSEHIQQLHTNPLKHYRNITESKNRNINFYLIYYPAKKTDNSTEI